MPISWGKTKSFRGPLEKLVGRSLLELAEKEPSMLTEGARRRPVSLGLFDIEGFIELTNYASPEAIVELLNAYFGGITRCVTEHQGLVDAFFNEAVFTIFGAPQEDREHPLHACQAALAGMREIVRLAAQWQIKGFARIKASIALCTGPCIVGNFGSEQRLIYTAIGDLVNWCEQLRACTRLYGVPILISRETAAAVRGQMVTRELDTLRVPGGRTTTVHELVGMPDSVSAPVREAMGLFERGLELYRRREWEQAESYFADVNRLVGDDGPSRLFTRRCQHYMLYAPPPEWDYVHAPSQRLDTQ
ncbi:MAG: hypothetical protein HPKKFMNG_02185 [Planctomycetes bacterium]|nr:hypothetical protein [Planctomycetota bacterium]MCQ3948495.1 hypothetical protein [Planctomycetota bacterium]GIK51361.1 MAG: hypothetical protein BroJett014_03340 [Planctomycetota bacterium]HRJ77464.1 adenylate/guanylate cyclase domain-containing protein [Planctomycetota bacterium]